MTKPFQLYRSAKTLASSVADSPLKRSANRLVVGKCFCIRYNQGKDRFLSKNNKKPCKR